VRGDTFKMATNSNIPTQKKRRKKSKLYRHESRAAFLFILAPLVGYLLFTLYPFFYSIYASFTTWNGLGFMKFVGFDNYINLLTDDLFHKSLFNTFFMMMGTQLGYYYLFISNGIKSVVHIQTVTGNLDTILSTSQQMNSSIQEVASISQESAAGVEETSANAEQTSSSMEEVADSSNELSKSAEKLNVLVQQFKL